MSRIFVAMCVSTWLFSQAPGIFPHMSKDVETDHLGMVILSWQNQIKIVNTNWSPTTTVWNCPFSSGSKLACHFAGAPTPTAARNFDIFGVLVAGPPAFFRGEAWQMPSVVPLDDFGDKEFLSAENLKTESIPL